MISIPYLIKQSNRKKKADIVIEKRESGTRFSKDMCLVV